MGNSREIDNAGVQDFLNLYNVEPYFVTPGHCDSRGSLEWAHSTIIELMNAIQIQNKDSNTDKNIR